MTQRPITEVLNDLRDQGSHDLDELLPLVYAELRRLAGAHLSRERNDHTLQPTALVHEAYLKLIGQSSVEWQGRAHFFGIASRLMREILIDHARSRQRQKRGGPQNATISIDSALSLGDNVSLDVLAINEALVRLEEIDPQQARIVELKFFGGLNIEEVAHLLDISASTVKREWATAKIFLRNALSASK